MDLTRDIYRVELSPDASLRVEDTGNVVLVTPERRITITNVERWVNELGIARDVAAAGCSPTAEPPVGTIFYRAGKPVWTRRADGWHCGRSGCTRCPCGWDEVWDVADVRDGTARKVTP